MLKINWKRHWPILALVAFNLLVGILVVKNYGLSADEPRFIEYAHQSLNAYQSWLNPRFKPEFGNDDLRYYGPAYAMLIALASSALKFLFSGLFEPHIWHYSTFLALQITGLCLYSLASRWFSRQTALVLAALFLLQPLLWGHAFINPKDIPFLMAFSLSLTLGLYAIDKLPVGEAWQILSLQQLLAIWRKAGKSKKQIAVGGTLIWIILAAGLFFGWREIVSWIEIFVRFVLSEPNPLTTNLLHLFVSGSTLQATENYVAKAIKISGMLRMASLALGLGLVIFLYRPIFADWFAWSEFKNIKGFLQKCGIFFQSPAWLLAALALGLATSTRILGPWAGLLVSLYLFWRLRKNALPALFVYGLLAVICAYLTWPYLWPDPFGRFIASLNVMSAFPWQGKVLFDGVQYTADQLPVSYLPVLFSIQITEPALMLIGCGILKLALDLFRKNIAPDLAGLILGWLFLPILVIIATRRPLYDNFRQLLFLLPPFFLIGGLTLEAFFKRFTQSWVFLSVSLLLLVPGLIPLIRLHPYQYTYYNSFVGGLSGAAARYEMDYWATSYAEAMQYVDRVAPPDSKVLVWTFTEVARAYARPDLIVAPQTTKDVGHFDFAILTSRGDKNSTEFPNAPVLFEIRREGAVLSVVKDLSLETSK